MLSPREVARDLSNLLFFVFGEGSWRLRPHESKVLNAAISHLPDDTKAMVIRQLQQKYFIERTNKRINVFRYYTADDALSIPDPEFLDLLLRVKIMVDGRKEFANVTFYKGRLFSLEFKKPGRSYADRELEVVDVVKGKPSQTYTRAIDRAAHGRNSEGDGI